jgi:hypothetical protein
LSDPSRVPEFPPTIHSLLLNTTPLPDRYFNLLIYLRLTLESHIAPIEGLIIVTDPLLGYFALALTCQHQAVSINLLISDYQWSSLPEITLPQVAKVFLFNNS